MHEARSQNEFAEVGSGVPALGPRRRLPPRLVEAVVVRIGDAVIDVHARLVNRRGEWRRIGVLGARIVELLDRRRDCVVSREELLAALGLPDSGAGDRTLRSSVFRLRNLIEDDPTRPRHLLTVRKRGYRLVSERSSRG